MSRQTVFRPRRGWICLCCYFIRSAFAASALPVRLLTSSSDAAATDILISAKPLTDVSLMSV
jgi:hypothetical protein